MVTGESTLDKLFLSYWQVTYDEYDVSANPEYVLPWLIGNCGVGRVLAFMRRKVGKSQKWAFPWGGHSIKLTGRHSLEDHCHFNTKNRISKLCDNEPRPLNVILLSSVTNEPRPAFLCWHHVMSQHGCDWPPTRSLPQLAYTVHVSCQRVQLTRYCILASLNQRCHSSFIYRNSYFFNIRLNLKKNPP